MSVENYKTVFSEINEAEQIAAISFTFADRMKSVINSMAKEIQALEVERDEARLALRVYLENQERAQPPRALDAAATQSVEMTCPHCGLIIDVEIHQTPRQ
jgi:hypothetical protein